MAVSHPVRVHHPQGAHVTQSVISMSIGFQTIQGWTSKDRTKTCISAPFPFFLWILILPCLSPGTPGDEGTSSLNFLQRPYFLACPYLLNCCLLVCLFFQPICTARGISVLNRELILGPLLWNHRVPTTGPLGKSSHLLSSFPPNASLNLLFTCYKGKKAQK